jgi:hypothetical protein
MIDLGYLFASKGHRCMLVVRGSVASIRVSLILAIVNFESARMWSQNGLAWTHLDIICMVAGLVTRARFDSKFLHDCIHVHLCKS